MEKGKGFWTSDNKGWKTRREQQDLYRKALDQQIEDRKKMEKRSKSGKEPAPPVQISDPVQHLLPWMTNGSGEPSDTSSVATSLPEPTGPPAVQAVYGTPTPNQQLPPPTNYYYVANPLMSPTSNDFNNAQKASQLPPPPHASAQLPAGLSSTEQNSPAFSYYGTAAIPPPPAFNSSFYGGYAIPQPGAPASNNAQQQMPPQINVPPYAPSDVALPPPPPVIASPISSPSGKSKASFWTDNSDFKSAEPFPGLEKGVVKPGKVHVSQTSEEVFHAHTTPSKNDYRKDLERQVEEKKALEEERQRKAKEEEEQFQKRVHEDQDRMEREYKEEQCKAEKKKESERLKQEAVLRKIEETKKRLEEEKNKEGNRRRKEIEERNRKLTLKEETTRNARAGQDTSPTRYYPREDSKAWSWESQPIPVLANKTKSNTSVTSEKSNVVGGGDASESIIDPKYQTASSEIFSSVSQQSEKSSARSTGTLVTESDKDQFQEDFQDYKRQTQPNSPSSTRTYSVTMSELEHENNNAVPPAGSKSAEDFSSPASAVLQGCNDGMMCPKCCRSFSSTDFRLPGTEPERQQIRNFLENISKNLKEEKERLIRGGFNWRR